MKAIINGKRYDTETATEIARHWNGYGDNDFNFIAERLYKTKKGQYFLFGRGGAQTEYASCHGNCNWSGSRLEPMTSEEARAWLERHRKVEALEAEFGNTFEDA